jgi:hypothetical protein
MLLRPPLRENFDFRGPLQVDVGNSGFTDTEMAELAGPDPVGTDDNGKGISDWWRAIWGTGRQSPPDITNLQSEFGYLSNPDLIDLPALAKAEKVPLAGIIKASSSRYNYYVMRCGVYINPQNSEIFEALKFEVSYSGANISTHSMLPGPQTKTLIEAGGKATIGITGGAEFGIPEISAANVSAKVDVQTKFVVSFSLRAEDQGGRCFWRRQPVLPMVHA